MSDEVFEEVFGTSECENKFCRIVGVLNIVKEYFNKNMFQLIEYNSKLKNGTMHGDENSIFNKIVEKIDVWDILKYDYHRMIELFPGIKANINYDMVVVKKRLRENARQEECFLDCRSWFNSERNYRDVDRENWALTNLKFLVEEEKYKYGPQDLMSLARYGTPEMMEYIMNIKQYGQPTLIDIDTIFKVSLDRKNLRTFVWLFAGPLHFGLPMTTCLQKIYVSYGENSLFEIMKIHYDERYHLMDRSKNIQKYEDYMENINLIAEIALKNNDTRVLELMAQHR
jgi:hypothetical protein